MEKTVVRRGIGAVVLALVAALLLGYLLKGKGPERKEVVNMELPKSPIQIFPSDNADTGNEKGASGNAAESLTTKGNLASNDADQQGQSGANADKQDASSTTAGAAAAGGAAATGFFAKAKNMFSFGKKDENSAGTGTGAGDQQMAQAGGNGDGQKAGAGDGKNGGQLAQAGGSGNSGQAVDKTGAGKDHVIDPKTGNASLAKGKVTVDGAGQAVFGVKEAGPKDSPSKIAFRTTAKKEVRPSVEGKATLKKKVASQPKQKAKSQPRKSNARLVGEKKLPPVGRGVAHKRKPSSKERKVASSRGKPRKDSATRKVASRSGKKNASRSAKKITSNTKKTSGSKKKIISRNSHAKVAKSSTKKSERTGRNKYVVQLLATSNSAKANNLKATLKREGYPAFVSTAKRGGKSLYRVRVGSYAKSVALKKQASMKRRYRKNSYIQSSIVVRN